MNRARNKTWSLLAFAWATSCCDAPLVRQEPALQSAAANETTTTIAVAPQPTAGSPAPAAPVVRGPDGKFADSVQIADQTLKLNGQGLCEWGWIGIDLYRAAFYIPSPSRDAAAILAKPQPALIHLAFVRALTKSQLDEAFTAAVAANAADPSVHAAALDALRATLSDVADGDSLSFTVEPGSRLVVHKNDQLAGTVDDAAFAWLFVELYIGAKPPTAMLKAGLLGMPG